MGIILGFIFIYFVYNIVKVFFNSSNKKSSNYNNFSNNKYKGNGKGLNQKPFSEFINRNQNNNHINWDAETVGFEQIENEKK